MLVPALGSCCLCHFISQTHQKGSAEFSSVPFKRKKSKVSLCSAPHKITPDLGTIKLSRAVELTSGTFREDFCSQFYKIPASKTNSCLTGRNFTMSRLIPRPGRSELLEPYWKPKDISASQGTLPFYYWKLKEWTESRELVWMRNTVTRNKPVCHKDHRTVPLSIITKITVREKEDLGCVYTKSGEKLWFPVRQRHIFER